MFAGAGPGLDPRASLFTTTSSPSTRQERGAGTLGSVDMLIQELPQSSLHRGPKGTHAEGALRDLGGPRKQSYASPGTPNQQHQHSAVLTILTRRPAGISVSKPAQLARQRVGRQLHSLLPPTE